MRSVKIPPEPHFSLSRVGLLPHPQNTKSPEPWCFKGFRAYSGKKVTTLHCIKYSVVIWRRVRDLNPSYAINVNTISSRAPSTTQPTLHGLQRCVVHNGNYYNAPHTICQHYFVDLRKLFSSSFRDCILRTVCT